MREHRTKRVRANRSHQLLASLAILTVLCALPARAATIVVNTLTDEFNTPTPNGSCSLREAVRSANTNADFGGCTHSGSFGTDSIALGSGTHFLTRTGAEEDLSVSGDIDIASSLSIDGVGASNTVIRGDAGYSGRILHVISGTVVLSDLTIRDGNLAGSAAGAGLRTEPGSVTTLNKVVVGLNTAGGNAGGILNRATMTLNGSVVNDNATLNSTEGGGGIYNSPNATLTLNDSRVLDNATSGTGGNGAGIYNDQGATLTLDNTTVDGNVADDDNTIDLDRADGGGIYSAGNLTIVQSTISNNEARGNEATGGGILCGPTAVTLAIDRSVISGNKAVRDSDIYDDSPAGGGIWTNCLLELTDSVVRDNTAEAGGAGGGILMRAGTIRNSTISGNRALGGTLFPEFSGLGGGVLVGDDATLVNSTISGNEAESHGGGVYVPSGGVLTAYSSTIVDNESNSDGISGGEGGGVFLEPGGGQVPAGALFMGNSVLAGNLENGVGDHDDCDGVITTQGYNLIGSTSGCGLSAGADGDVTNALAKLGALADNGGPDVGSSTSELVVVMLTHNPVSDSPVLDAGNPAGCREVGNAPLADDQRGLPRSVDGPDPGSESACDIGAVERQGPPNLVFANGYE